MAEKKVQNKKSIDKKSVETDNTIYFFGELDSNYGFLSNFYKSPFVDKNINYFCSEQYFMYNKCLEFDPENEEIKTKILKEISQHKIKLLGRQVKNFNQARWNEVKEKIMLAGLKLKFSQNQDIRQKLLNTGDKEIIEASPYDKIWGIGFSPKDAPNTNRNKYGSNLLGINLMIAREWLKTQQ